MLDKSSKKVVPVNGDGTIEPSTGLPASGGAGRRSRVPQSDVPLYSLDEALRVPRAIADHYAFEPTRPLDVAAALRMQPNSGGFRMLIGSAVAFGLTSGGYSSSHVSVQSLARKILVPSSEEDELDGRREALLKPRVIREFLTRYDSNKVPRQDIAVKVLADMGIPKEAVNRTLKTILDGARAVGFFKEIKGVEYVNLKATAPRSAGPGMLDASDRKSSDDEDGASEMDLPPVRLVANNPAAVKLDNRRVFITHGKNLALIDPLKELLAFGEMEPVVSVEQESVSLPVPDKVMAEMRSCGAAIIHVDAEQKLIDPDGNPCIALNPNVLIEIGGAMALYGRRFILLVKTGIRLPSNLQGLYEVRYDGDKLDGDSTIRLLKAIKDIKNHELPGHRPTAP